MAKVVSIKICEVKGQGRREISEGMFQIDHGLLGDIYSQPGDRQVNIMCQSTRDFVNNFHIHGHCFDNFVETLLIDGVDLFDYGVGTRVKIGQAIMEISKHGKRCWPECEIIKQKEVCRLKSEPIFARVIKSGLVKVGDLVEIVK